MLSDASLLLDRLLAARRGQGSLVVAFVGAGGKTSSIFALAEAARSRGLSTVIATTTAMRDPRAESGRRIDRFLDRPPEGRLPSASVSFVLGSIELADEAAACKVKGLTPQELRAYVGFGDLLLVEADGSKRLPLKAPATHEPVIPDYSDAVVACLGVDAYGRPADASRIHRLDRFLAVTGLGEGAIVDAQALRSLVAHPEGSFKGSPSSARRLVLLCKADLLPQAVLEALGAAIEAAGTAEEVLALSLGAPFRESNLKSVKVSSVSPPRPVVVRGAGDLASGVILRLHRAGYPLVILEAAEPSAIRRSVAFSEAVRNGLSRVEDVEAGLVANVAEATALLAEGKAIPLLVDPEGATIAELKPRALVDAIMAKRNLGTARSMAPLVIALGPGFEAGIDVHAVVETNRGHALGRVIWKGGAEPDTGRPGEIGGASNDRVLHAPATGVFHALEVIGSIVTRDQIIAYVESNNERFNLYSKLDGVLRGILPDGFAVREGFKVADVDPRARVEHCATVSDKSLAMGGAVLEALLGKGILP